MFDVPREQVRGYFDPHKGVHFRVPAAYLGVDEGLRIKRLAAIGATARVSVRAERDDGDRTPIRTLIATLPGQSLERIVYQTHTDGATWVQENGSAAMLALARYFAALPTVSRPRTFEFVFGSGHLHIARNGTEFYAATLDPDYEQGTVAFAVGLEHLGTREFEAVPRRGGPGKRVEPTGRGETATMVTESPALAAAAIAATTRRGLDRTSVLHSLSVPAATVPACADIGGDISNLHAHLIPSLQLISGPWTLWAPAFGEQAVDFGRMRRQALAAADIAVHLGQVPRQLIAGPFLAYRAARAAGVQSHRAVGVPLTHPEDAPGPG